MKLDRRSLYVLQNVSQLTAHAGKDGISGVPTIQKIPFHLFKEIQNGAFTATLHEIFPFLPLDSFMKLGRRSLYVLQNVSQLTAHAGKDRISRVPTIQKIVLHLFIACPTSLNNHEAKKGRPYEESR